MNEVSLGEDIFQDRRQEVAQDWTGQQGASDWVVGCMAGRQLSVWNFISFFSNGIGLG